MMLESIVTLIRETQPRWRQQLLGLPDEPGAGAGPGRSGPAVERSISGGGASGVGLGGGPAGPGGPPQLSTAVSAPSADFLMSAASASGALGTAMMGNNPSSSIQALNLDGTTATVSTSLIGLVDSEFMFMSLNIRRYSIIDPMFNSSSCRSP